MRISSTQFPIDVAVTWGLDGIPLVEPAADPYAQAAVNGFLPDGTPVGVLQEIGQPLPHAVFWNKVDAIRLSSVGRGGFAITGNDAFILGASFVQPETGGTVFQVATRWLESGPQLISGLEMSNSIGQSVSSAGIYVGLMREASNLGGTMFGGFIGRNGTAQRLNFPGFPETRGFEINDDGWFTGIWESNDVHLRGYRARIDLDTGEQEIHDLGLFEDNLQTLAQAINNDGTIVGGAVGGPFGDVVRALIWPEGATAPLDLNTFVDIPGVTLIDAYRINNAGQILAEARLDDGSGFAYFRLDPVVPEPAGIAVMGFAGVAVLRRRA